MGLDLYVFDMTTPEGQRAFRGAGPAWSHDYPTAEQNLHKALLRTTKVHVEGEPLVLRLSDKRIFEHPILYICEPGYWTLEENEVANLKEYIDRGGFLLFDDFRGEHLNYFNLKARWKASPA